MRTRIFISVIGLFFAGAAFANCPNHNTVIYSCQAFNGHTQCSWNPIAGWYQGSAAQDSQTQPGVHATRFLRAFWTPNAHMVDSSKVSYGVTICQYSYNKGLILLYQKDRDINIPDPRLHDKNNWFLSDWQGVKGFACASGEGQCNFEYGERF